MDGFAGAASGACAAGAPEQMELTMTTASFQSLVDADWSDRDVLRHLQCWREAMTRVRALGIRTRPLDPDRYWHYFACTD